MQTHEHLQASSFNTTSGAEAERIQRMFSLLSSSVQPCSFGLGTLGLASKQHPQIAAWKLALCVCRKRQSLHSGSWLDSAAPLFAHKSWYRSSLTLLSPAVLLLLLLLLLPAYIAQVNCSSFSKSSVLTRSVPRIGP